ncbi:MAG: hypothetical protein JXA57_08385 [Armatimonadetes bacterium]|nr:hypothetical protein [Armatimonadota bacterium]
MAEPDASTKQLGYGCAVALVLLLLCALICIKFESGPESTAAYDAPASGADATLAGSRPDGDSPRRGPKRQRRSSGGTAMPAAETPATPRNLTTPGVVAGAARSRLEADNVSVISCDLADGRAQGGERVLIVAYRTRLEPGTMLALELVGVLLIGREVNEADASAEIDSVVAIAGDRAGGTVACVTGTTRDVALRIAGVISLEEFLARLTWGPGWKPPDGRYGNVDVYRSPEFRDQPSTPPEATFIPDPPPLPRGLRVTGIIGGKEPLASMKDWERQSYNLRAGDYLANGWTVKRILEREVVLRHAETGAETTLELGALP